MNTITLKTLLMEYHKKKIRAEKTAEQNRIKLYEENPKLSAIDKKLSSLAITTMKEVLQTNHKDLILQFHSETQKLKEEKEKILASLGEAAKKIFPQYECQKCQDTGYVVDGPSTKMCSCLQQKIYDIEYNKANMGQLEKQNFEHFHLSFYSTEVCPEKFHSAISPQENMKLIQKICLNFISHFDNPEEKNLLFTGKTGLGKTFLSSCIANELLKQGKTVLYQTASVMLDTIIHYRFGKSTTSSDIYQHLLNVDLLIIDDLGTEGTNNMKLVELFNLLNSRLLTNQSTKTIISTNLSLQDLFQIYDERIVSRIVGNYNICYFFGDDIRFLKK